MTVYDNDFYQWTQDQAALLRQGALGLLDISHLIDEIESMGNSEKRELESRLRQLLLHLLEWQYQPSYQGQSWLLTIKEQRLKVAHVLRDNPSLKHKLPLVAKDAYESARFAAAKETGIDLDAFPESCPWTFDQYIHDEFLPNG
ncbi:MAG: DUF29 domain-containing protein [Methyloglobulus sp.]|nr:DUF29 domain-containing protein [Methyloglobulus sp.]